MMKVTVAYDQTVFSARNENCKKFTERVSLSNRQKKRILKLKYHRALLNFLLIFLCFL